MTDAVFIPYSRFLEVRARRLETAAELLPPDGEAAINGAAPAAPVDCEERARIVVSVLEIGPAAVEQS